MYVSLQSYITYLVSHTHTLIYHSYHCHYLSGGLSGIFSHVGGVGMLQVYQRKGTYIYTQIGLKYVNNNNNADLDGHD